eukprot:sb/3460898/
MNDPDLVAEVQEDRNEGDSTPPSNQPSEEEPSTIFSKEQPSEDPSTIVSKEQPEPSTTNCKEQPEPSPTTSTEQSSEEPSTTTEPMEQPSTTTEPMEQPSTTTEPMDQPSTTTEPMEQPSATAEPMEQPPTTTEPMEQPSTRTEPMEQPSTTTEPMEQPSATTEPMEQPSTTTEPMETLSAEVMESGESAVGKVKTVSSTCRYIDEEVQPVDKENEVSKTYNPVLKLCVQEPEMKTVGIKKVMSGEVVPSTAKSTKTRIDCDKVEKAVAAFDIAPELVLDKDTHSEPRTRSQKRGPPDKTTATRCVVCDKVFKDDFHLSRHYKVAYSSIDFKFHDHSYTGAVSYCSYCLISFTAPKQWSSHKIMLHQMMNCDVFERIRLGLPTKKRKLAGAELAIWEPDVETDVEEDPVLVPVPMEVPSRFTQLRMQFGRFGNFGGSSKGSLFRVVAGQPLSKDNNVIYFSFSTTDYGQHDGQYDIHECDVCKERFGCMETHAAHTTLIYHVRDWDRDTHKYRPITESTYKGMLYRCSFCGKKYQLSGELQQHQVMGSCTGIEEFKHHYGTLNVSLKVERKGLVERTEQYAEDSKLSESDNIYCTKCYQTFPSSTPVTLYRHRELMEDSADFNKDHHYIGLPGTFECSYCETQCSTLQLFEKHQIYDCDKFTLKSPIKSADTRIKCCVCKEVFDTIEELDQHSNIVAASIDINEQHYPLSDKCSYCDEIFKTFKELYNHQKDDECRVFSITGIALPPGLLPPKLPPALFEDEVKLAEAIQTTLNLVCQVCSRFYPDAASFNLHFALARASKDFDTTTHAIKPRANPYPNKNFTCYKCNKSDIYNYGQFEAHQIICLRVRERYGRECVRCEDNGQWTMEELAKHIYWSERTINYYKNHSLRNEEADPFCCFYCGIIVPPWQLQDHQLKRCWRYRNSCVVRGRLRGKGEIKTISTAKSEVKTFSNGRGDFKRVPVAEEDFKTLSTSAEVDFTRVLVGKYYVKRFFTAKGEVERVFTGKGNVKTVPDLKREMGGPKPCKCDVCGEPMSGPVTLIRHHSVMSQSVDFDHHHHVQDTAYNDREDLERRLRCSYCLVHLKRQASLFKHQKEECKLTGFQNITHNLEEAKNLSKVEPLFTTTTKGRLKCRLCDVKIVSSQFAARHVILMRNSLDFDGKTHEYIGDPEMKVCGYCDKICTSRTKLEEHQYKKCKVFEGVGENNTVKAMAKAANLKSCEKCNVDFLSKIELKLHRKLMKSSWDFNNDTHELYEDSREGDLPRCSYCGEVVKTGQDLADHQLKRCEKFSIFEDKYNQLQEENKQGEGEDEEGSEEGEHKEGGSGEEQNEGEGEGEGGGEGEVEEEENKGEEVEEMVVENKGEEVGEGGKEGEQVEEERRREEELEEVDWGEEKKGQCEAETGAGKKGEKEDNMGTAKEGEQEKNIGIGKEGENMGTVKEGDLDEMWDELLRGAAAAASSVEFLK